MRHRLFFDVTELSGFDKGTGIQRVTRALLQALRQAPPADWKVVAVRGDGESGRFITYTALTEHQLTGLPKEPDEVAIDPAEGDIFLSVDLAYNMTAALRQELVRFKSHGVGVYFVIYDLIPLMYPEWFAGTNAWFEGNDYLELFNYWFDTVSEEGDGLICISDSVRKDLHRWLVERPLRRTEQPEIEYFHLGSDITESIPSTGLPEDAESILQTLEASTTFLMVGTLEPRKGHELALDTIERLWDQGQEVNLVFVGRAGWKIDALINRLRGHPRLGKQLFWLDGISDEFLRRVYLSASALLALSSAEGFGLPLVEAAHFRVPLIVRDIPVFREVCSEAAVYFKGTTSEDLQALLLDWLAQREAGATFMPEKMEVLSWPDSARQLMAAVGKMRGNVHFWSNVPCANV